MSKQFFKVKKGLHIDSVDPSTILDPQSGDLIIDSSDDNKLKIYNTDSNEWEQTGGAGGGQSLDTVFQLFAEEELSTWTTASIVDSSFTKNTITPMNGDASYLFTKGSTGITESFITPNQDVAARFRGQNVTLYFPYSYNGTNDKISVTPTTGVSGVFTEQSEVFLEATNGAVKVFKMTMTLMSNVDSFRIKFKSFDDTDGSVFAFDDIQLTSDTTVYAELQNRTQSEILLNVGNLTQTTNLASFAVANDSGVRGIYTKSAAGLTFHQDANVVVTYSNLNSGSQTYSQSQILLNGAWISGDQVEGGSNHNTSVTANIRVKAGDRITFIMYRSGGTNVSSTNVQILATASNTNILTPPDTFSTDTNPLTFSNTYDLNTLTNAPIGTYIVFGYGTPNSNTRTQFTTRPNQTDADMMLNGIRIYTRAYSGTTPSGFPSCVAINIGKGMKGVSLSLYKNAGKQISGELDYFLGNNFSTGARIKSYDADKGILLVDAGFTWVGATANASFTFSDTTDQTNGYLSIHASKNPALVGINQPARYVVKTFSSGWDWYEVYNDGWVRQTIGAGASSSSVSFLITMRDTNYFAVNTAVGASSSSANWTQIFFTSMSTTNISYGGVPFARRIFIEGYASSAALASLGIKVDY